MIMERCTKVLKDHITEIGAVTGQASPFKHLFFALTTVIQDSVTSTALVRTYVRLPETISKPYLDCQFLDAWYRQN